MNIQSNRLIKGDCLQIMDQLIEEGIKVDAVITDPPYGTTACKWDSVIPFDEMWPRLKELRNDNTPIVLFGSEPFSSALRMSNIKEFKYDWIWEKHKPSNFALAKKHPMKYHENIIIFYQKQALYNPQMIKRESERIRQHQKTGYIGQSINYGELNSLKTVSNDFNKYDASLKLPSSVLKISAIPGNSKEKVKHPTQKPVELMEYLIKTYTKPGDTVLDFTMGSGSTGVACVNTGRNFIGIELDENYFNIAKERIENATKETK